MKIELSETEAVDLLVCLREFSLKETIYKEISLELHKKIKKQYFKQSKPLKAQ